MKKRILVLGIIAVLAPAALAFAEDNNQGQPPPPPRMHGNINIEEGMHGSTTMMMDGEHMRMMGSSTMPMPPMPGDRGEKSGISKHFGTTTPPGLIHRGEGSTTPPMMHREASSSDERRGNDNQKGGGDKGMPFVSGILHWIFGQPGSTTIDDLKQQIASGTASTTPPAPKGFLHDIFLKLGWFK